MSAAPSRGSKDSKAASKSGSRPGSIRIWERSTQSSMVMGARWASKEEEEEEEEEEKTREGGDAAGAPAAAGVAAAEEEA